ncbi:MAG: hypothetical protein GC160_18805 [Acidobacteria bacterium]|nr:hypothetical protein [Acidobacteriota bacterium]
MRVYRPASQYLPASLVAASLGAFSAWCGFEWSLAFIPAGLFVLSAALLYYLGSRPPIEVTDRGLRIGDRSIVWSDIDRIETTSWNAPLVLKLTLTDSRKLRLVYPGDVASADRLWREIRRKARAARRRQTEASLNEQNEGRPDPAVLRAPRSRLLRHEDEQEINELYRQLKAVGRLDSSAGGSDERAEDARN